MTTIKPAQRVAPFPQQPKNLPADQGHVNDGYDSEESVNEKVSVPIGTEVWTGAGEGAVGS
jgi:hypothetical protein